MTELYTNTFSEKTKKKKQLTPVVLPECQAKFPTFVWMFSSLYSVLWAVRWNICLDQDTPSIRSITRAINEPRVITSLNEKPSLCHLSRHSLALQQKRETCSAVTMRTLLLAAALSAGLLGSLAAPPAPVPVPYRAFCRTVWWVGLTRSALSSWFILRHSVLFSPHVKMSWGIVSSADASF